MLVDLYYVAMTVDVGWCSRLELIRGGNFVAKEEIILLTVDYFLVVVFFKYVCGEIPTYLVIPLCTSCLVTLCM